MSRLSARSAWGARVAPVAFVAAAVFAGCGASGHPPPLGDPSHDGGGALDAGTGFDFDAPYIPPPCGVGPDGGVCACFDLPLLTDRPNLYFVLDRSGSMNDLNKWTTVRIVIGQVVMKLGPRAAFGATVFPNPQGGDCSVGKEVAPLTVGDSPAGTYGPATSTLLSSTNYVASGGTPTAATIASLTSKLTAFTGRTYAILATDGGPNCNSALACDFTQCIPNIESQSGCSPSGPTNCCDAQHGGPQSCLDADATVQAVTALKAAGVPTYVIGVPGSGPYSAVLDRVAQAGGTARATSPFYYRVDTADTAAFSAALSQIAAKITATCTLPLGTKPPDPNLINVYLDGAVVPKDPVDGWTFDGTTVTLVGAACAKVLNGDVLDVRVIAGCPTVLK